jgi:hypothetical protein
MRSKDAERARERDAQRIGRAMNVSVVEHRRCRLAPCQDQRGGLTQEPAAAKRSTTPSGAMAPETIWRTGHGVTTR